MTTIEEKLKQGVEAARAGRNREAQELLTDVLKEDTSNIPALFWLAFVLPDPKVSIQLLERVLALDPDNERAQAGIRWAKERLAEAGEDPEAVNEDPIDLANIDGATLRERLLSKEATQDAKKGPLAHRARRTFDLTILFLTLGVLGVLTAAGGLFIFAPNTTLAAWQADDVVSQTTNSDVTFVEVEEVAAKVSQVNERHLASDTDTILMQLPELMGVEAESVSQVSVSQNSIEPATELDPIVQQVSSVPAPEQLNIIPAAPSTLIGPEISETEAEVEVQPVQNLLLAHQPAYEGEKWIEVNVSTQQITAWEGDQPVFSFIGSTGLPNTPTVLGKYNVYWKLESTLMAGADYYLPDVPYTMYFHQGYALHGAYWHENFGNPMSHGCVNLSLGDAKMLFEWADPIIPPGQTQVVATADNPGTLVVVHQ